MIVVGIMGAIGSGKSKVAECLKEAGAEVLNADAMAHEVLNLPEIIQQITARWGEDILDEDGTINRKGLADRVFSNKEKLKELENLIHPLVRKKMTARMEEIRQQSPETTLVLDIPLLAERDLDKTCDVLLYVDTAEEVCLKRISSTRGWTAEQVKERQSHQMSLEEKKERADYVIDNSQGIDSLKKQVQQIYQQIISKQEEDMQKQEKTND